jgi:hypothetical protein
MIKTKLFQTFVALGLAFSALNIIFSQEKPKPELIDQFGKKCSEEFAARDDQFMIRLHENPDSKGYILFNGQIGHEGRNENYAHAFKIYPQTLRRDTSRIVIIRGENLEEMEVKFWIVPPGAEPPAFEKEYKRGPVTATTLYDRNWADFHRPYGRLEIYESGFFVDWSCDFPPNVDGFAATLLENPDLTGYLITYTKFGRGAKRGTQVGRFAVNDLVRNYKIPRKRLKRIYGGNRKEPEIELWLAPKGGEPPVPTPDKRSTTR